jgi:sialate O-acetylesterase
MSKRLLVVVFLAALAWLSGQPARADVKPHPLFSDGMVLQRDVPCPIWGTASPEEKISYLLDLGGGRAAGSETTADKAGNWKVTTPKLKAGGPYTLIIAGNNKVVINDIYVGEVWIASGQSNMEQAINSTANADEAKKNATNPKLRLFTVDRIAAETPQETIPVIDKTKEKPGSQIKGKWLEAGPDTIGSFSAVAYYFGRDLQKALDVPVGIIHTSWGGTASEEWTSMKVLDAHPEHKGKHPRQAKLYNGMIAPLIPYAIKGAIWYQGESNAGRAELYRSGFPLMIKNWRDDWKQGDFPFLFVQLAPWRIPPPANNRDHLDPWQAVSPQPGENAWAELREAQRLTSLTVKNTAMAVITDVGDADDIHPRRKEPVGARLALAARAVAYGEKVEYSGPVYQSMDVEGNRAVLHFAHVGKGLDAKYGVPLGFTVAGEDKKFYNANAEIKGDTVVVWCDKVSKPVAVRFGWANCPVVDFWNKDGLPASPFRTDDFPMVTATKKESK